MNNRMTWTKHKEKWKGCSNCELCETRSRTVLFKGSIPCDVLFVGEAPGFSEDTIGKPFIGPAGKLLDAIIKDATRNATGYGLKMGYTNLISCIPLGEGRKKVSAPEEEWIKACGSRLNELVHIAKPRAVVMVGKLSQKWCPVVIDYDFEFSRDIIHPAAILRVGSSQQGLAIQKCVINLRDLFMSMVKPF